MLAMYALAASVLYYFNSKKLKVVVIEQHQINLENNDT